MAVEVKSFDSPDEVRPFEGKGQADVVNVAGRTVGRGTFEPGWKSSEWVQPIAGTASCQASHTGYMISGWMKVVMDDGAEAEFGPGSAVVIPPGHDAWIGGDEPAVFIDFTGAAQYAKQ